MSGDGEGSACSLLVIILDTNPVWWGRNLNEGEAQLTLTKCLDSVFVFANSHLTMNHQNKLAVIAAHTNQSHFLYPKHEIDGIAVENGVPDGDVVDDGKYELFGQMNSLIKTEIKQLVLNSLEGEIEGDTLLAGAMGMALCYIHRLEKECPVGTTLSSRILVLKGSDDNPAQYMNFMNTVFTAQKQNVVIDACVLDNDSGLLQQACDISGGLYLKIPQPTGLLQYLLWVFLPDPTIRGQLTLPPKAQWVFLPDPTIRGQLTLPPKAQVDFRAACFCHRNLIDIGYVCSVCLSIFCNFSPICSTCQTTFKIKGPMKVMKKKSKKAAS